METHSIEVLFEFLEDPNPSLTVADLELNVEAWYDDLLLRAITTTNNILNNHSNKEIIMLLEEVNGRLENIKEKLNDGIWLHLDARWSAINQYEQKFRSVIQKACMEPSWTLKQKIFFCQDSGIIDVLRRYGQTDKQVASMLSFLLGMSEQNIREQLGKIYNSPAKLPEKIKVAKENMYDDLERCGVVLIKRSVN